MRWSAITDERMSPATGVCVFICVRVLRGQYGVLGAVPCPPPAVVYPGLLHAPLGRVDPQAALPSAQLH